MNAQQLAVKILSKHFAEKQTKNPNYSLRSFAKQLQMSPSALSEMLSGKRAVSFKTAQKIAQRLLLDPHDQRRLFSMFETGRKPSQLGSSIALDSQRFRVIADWHYFAILSLSETKDFSDDAVTIATRLNISPAKASAAIETLERLGLLKRTDGKLKPTGAQFESSDEVLNLGVQRNHRQGLELAQASLSDHSLSERDFTALTLAVDPDKIPKAKNMIRTFRKKLAAALECGNKREVYRLQIQLFPLSRRSTQNETAL